MGKIKTIIFDLGGVYLNRGLWKFWDYVEDTFTIPKEEVRKNFLKYYTPYFSGKITEEDFWRQHLKDLKIKKDWKELREKLINYFEPQKGMPKLINKLRKNYRVGLLSDQTKEWWPYLDGKYKISDNFDFTIISYKTGFHKPQIEIYKIALEKANYKPKECLFIDDLEHNLEPAKDLGMKTLLFKNPEQIKKDLEDIGIKIK
ncbi:HAD family phosphatase [Candidatus Pacearchaeota archaeon]|nr:HAD family phosphatase [Candidatus Pacearchaeota archaeon]